MDRTWPKAGELGAWLKFPRDTILGCCNVLEVFEGCKMDECVTSSQLFIHCATLNLLNLELF